MLPINTYSMSPLLQDVMEATFSFQLESREDTIVDTQNCHSCSLIGLRYDSLCLLTKLLKLLQQVSKASKKNP